MEREPVVPRDAGRTDLNNVKVSLGPRHETINVSLIRPPCVVLVNSLSVVGPMPPVGLAYIAASLRAHGHDVHLVDAAGEALDQLVEIESASGTLRRIGKSPEAIVAQLAPETDLIGISNMFLHEWPTVRRIAELARERFPDATVIVGGDNATAFWPWMFEQTSAIDAVVKGEGEATAVELAACIAEGRPYDRLAGLAVRRPSDNSSAAVDNGLPARLRRLGEIPRPAWDLFPMDEYFASRNWLGVDRGRSMPMLATRGCPYKCTFCSSPQMWTTRYVVREPADIVDEIAYYVDRYGIVDFVFVDLTAMTKRQWTLDFCDALDERNLDITWQIPVGTRSEGIDEHVLKRLWETGCRNITYAPESGSERLLEAFDKRLDLDHILQDIRAAHSLGMIVHVNTIIGHPAERWSDRWANLVFLVRCALAGADTASPQMFHPYPGSRDFDDLYGAGRIEMDEGFYYEGLSKASPRHESWNEHISSRSLYLVQLAMLMAFYGLRPWRIVSSFVRAAGKGHERSLLDQLFRTKLRGPLRVTRRRPRRVTPAPAIEPAGGTEIAA